MATAQLPPLNDPNFQIRLLRLSPSTSSISYPSQDGNLGQGKSSSPVVPASLAESTLAENLVRGQDMNGYVDGLTPNPSQKRRHENHIRVLLQGVLEVFDLDSVPSFVALSYVWGSESDKKPFLLNGNTIQITENLAIALEHMKDESQEIMLWVDALCINQSDPQEKSVQVSRMRDIYKAADSVTVWLGPASESSDLLMDSLDKSGRRLFQLGIRTPVHTIMFEPDRLGSCPQLTEAFLSHDLESVSDYFKTLMEREWWSRVWTLQEFVVAEDVVFQWGKKRLKLDNFEAPLILFQQLWHDMDIHLHQSRDWLDLARNRSYKANSGHRGHVSTVIFQLRHNYRDATIPKRQTLEYLIKTLYNSIHPERGLKATDPRDKIYALLGIARDVDSLGIMPDYTKSVEDVYTEVTRKIIAKSGLNLLLLSKFYPNSKLPSWVPDFRQRLRFSPNDSIGLDKEFCAGGNGFIPDLIEPLMNEANVLTVKGSCIAQVSDLGAALLSDDSELVPSLDSSAQFVSEIEGYLVQAASMEACPYGVALNACEASGPEWLQEALYRLPVADIETTPDGRVRATEVTKSGFHSLMRVIQQYKAVAESDDASAGVASFSMTLMHEFSMFSLYLASVASNFGRRPFITANGYVGIGPENMQVGDEVFIIAGAAVPYVLRGVDGSDRLVLIGDAYVHGIMDGELVGKHSLLELKLQ